MTDNVAKWLRARQKKLKGAFDADTAVEAFSLLPGWSVSRSGALLHINQNNKGFLEGWLRRRLGMKDYPSIHTCWGDDEQWEIRPAEAASVIEVVPENRGKAAPGALSTASLYSTIEPEQRTLHGRAYVLARHPAVALPSFKVRAPSGATFEVLQDRPTDGFWKWAYGQGLAEAAAQLAPSDADVQAVRLAKLAAEKGKSYCSVCFGVYSYHDPSHAIVQHGYTMAGAQWGMGHEGMYKNSGDCPGVGFDAWKFSAAGTKRWVAALLGALSAARRGLAELQEGRVTSLSAIEVEEGWPRVKVWRLPTKIEYLTAGEKIQMVTCDHPAWKDLYASATRQAQGRVDAFLGEIAWYEAAIANWPAVPTRPTRG